MCKAIAIYILALIFAILQIDCMGKAVIWAVPKEVEELALEREDTHPAPTAQEAATRIRTIRNIRALWHLSLTRKPGNRSFTIYLFSCFVISLHW